MLPSFPQPGPISFPQGPMGTPVQLYESKAYLQKFLKGEPKVLRTVQIMIALMNFTLGMVLILVPMKTYYVNEYFLLHTGYIFWGTAFFIISGSLSIAAEKRTTNTLVQSSLAMNAVSSVAAGLGIIFFSVNLSMMDSSHYFCHYESPSDSCLLGMFILTGINVILLILAILELAISLAISSFGCKATCCSQSSITLVMPPPPYVPENPGAKTSLGEAMLRSTVSDTSALPGSQPDSFI
ncbi:membrane-spanning 4-domains subfamily A member 4A-like [Vombatus ursinus]|uniref:membrane-spanning 4-domains subfamily A member 4A-like n=1 Tax=Vombatus ursinus TaxID=29139 RepID=UPI000FFCE74F|nr:membrane-spanning 4-domains subfamily A member 4A-like [Vombatus ursinus]